jgi:hypothetical protein
MRRPLRWLIAMAGASLAIALLPAAALAASQPSIAWTDAWNLVPNDATVGAEIDPEGLPHGVYYQFQVVTNTSEYLPEIACSEKEIEPLEVDGCMGSRVPDALPIREISGTGGKFVNLDLEKAGMTLKPGTTYHYRVLAVKALASEDTLQWEPPAVIAPDQTFTTPLASTPAVESEADSHVTEHGATLEAKINSEDLPEGAYYQFQVVKNTSEYLPELACPEPDVLPPYRGDDCDSPDSGPHTLGALPIGYIAKGPEGQSVSLDLSAAGMTLQPDTTYHYRVLAAKRVQSEDGVDWQSPFAEGPDQTFTTPSVGNAPVIEGLSASHITQDDATLEAQINPEGLETTYELWMEDPCRPPMECIRVPRLLYGTIPATATSESLSIDLANSGEHLNIEPGMTYGYWVIAKNAAGTTEVQKTLKTLPASTAPVIESVSVSNLTPTDATLGAQINTEGQSTSYEFLLSYDPCPECEDLETVKIDLPSGLLLPSFQNQSVSLDLASVGVTLRHGGEYEYSLRAINASGKTEARTQTFRAPPPPVVEPLGSTTSPGPIGNEPEVPLANGLQTGSGGSSTPLGTGALGASSKTGAGTMGGKPKAKHGTHHKHHGKKAPKHTAKSKKHKYKHKH